MSAIHLAKKIQVNASIDSELVAWVDRNIRKKRFASRTHAIEFALQQLKEGEEAEG